MTKWHFRWRSTIQMVILKFQTIMTRVVQTTPFFHSSIYYIKLNFKPNYSQPAILMFMIHDSSKTCQLSIQIIWGPLVHTLLCYWNLMPAATQGALSLIPALSRPSVWRSATWSRRLRRAWAASDGGPMPGVGLSTVELLFGRQLVDKGNPVRNKGWLSPEWLRSCGPSRTKRRWNSPRRNNITGVIWTQ